MSAIHSPLAALQLGPAGFPGDPNSGAQYYFDRPTISKMSIDAETVWTDYTGKGVTVGVLDSVINHGHADIDGNYDFGRDIDLSTGSTDVVWDRNKFPDSHGTMVAGVIAAERGNDHGTIGVAHGSKVTSFAMDYNSNDVVAQAEAGIARGASVDVLNNSWSYGRAFQDNLKPGSAGYEALVTAVENGRDGLGTVVVFAGGNAGYSQSSNYHGYQNSPYTIAVGAVDKDGNAANFSSLGTNLLLSAAGVDIMTSEPYSGGVRTVSGTSFAAPIVSGASALILEANDQLGYRDVMEILALSARAEDLGTSSKIGYGWVTNGADNFNGGGMHFSDSFGFGYLNVHDAVRLAETWQGQQTYSNLVTATVEEKFSNLTLTAGKNDHISAKINVTQDVTMENAALSLKLPWSHTNDLEVFLTSPDGTVSQLVYDFDAKGGGGTLFNFALTTNAVLGESSKGTWSVDIYNRNPDLTHFSGTGPMTSSLQGATLTVRGSAPEANDVYFYNDEFASGYYDATEQLLRGQLTDVDGGTDTLNAAMVTSDMQIDLSGKTTSQIGEAALKIKAGTIENAFGGDGNDTLKGSASNNHLMGGRGNDTLHASGGQDRLDGGAGSDSLVFGVGTNALISASRSSDGVNLTFNIDGAKATTAISNIETFVFTNATYNLDGLLTKTPSTGAQTPQTPTEPTEPEAPEAPPSDGSGDKVTAEPEAPAAPKAPSVPSTPSKEYDFEEVGTDSEDRMVARGNHSLLEGKGGADTLISSAGSDDLYGDSGDDRLFCGLGDDRAYGGTGSDTLIGADGNDMLEGNDGDDILNGGDGNDMLYGGAGIDKLFAGKGVDHLFGGAGNDVLFANDSKATLEGGAGSDIYFCGTDVDTLIFTAEANEMDRVINFEAVDNVVVKGTAGADQILHYEEQRGGVMLTVESGGESNAIAFFARADIATLSDQVTFDYV